MQPLQLLRTHTCNKKPVILKDANGNVVTNVADASTVWFDDESFARNTPTTFPKNSSDDTYTLDTLIFLVQNEHLDNSAYFKECRQRDIEHVSIVDRKKVLDYLTGKVDTQPTKQSRSTSGKQNDMSYSQVAQYDCSGVRKQREDRDEIKDKAESNNENEPASKRVKFDERQSHVSIDKLREREKVLQSSASILQGDKDFYTIVKAMNPTFGKNGASSTIQKSSCELLGSTFEATLKINSNLQQNQVNQPAKIAFLSSLFLQHQQPSLHSLTLSSFWRTLSKCIDQIKMGRILMA